MSLLPLGCPFPLCPSVFPQRCMYRLLRMQEWWSWDRDICQAKRPGQAAGWSRGEICFCRVLQILFEAIFLFLVAKALCSLVHCLKSYQEISPCSGSAMPLVPACGRPGGECTGLFQGWSFVIRIIATLSPFVTHPVCTDRGGRGRKRDSSESVLLYSNSSYTDFRVEGKMLKSRFP